MESKIAVIHTLKLYLPIHRSFVSPAYGPQRFLHFSASNTIMLYNTTLTMLLGILRSLRSPGSVNCSFGFSIREATIEICWCVEYSFSNH